MINERTQLYPFSLVAAFWVLVTICVPPANSQDIQYREDPDADKHMTLLLRDWNPKSMVHLPAHEVPRAKFYVIDVHNHIDDAQHVNDEEVPPAAPDPKILKLAFDHLLLRRLSHSAGCQAHVEAETLDGRPQESLPL